MNKSILQDNKECYITGATNGLDKHHVFNGPLRKWSDTEGLWVWLRHDVHMAIHNSPDQMRRLKQAGQRAYEEKHSREEFMAHAHKNYL